MEVSYARITVFFENPFWVAVYEREEAGRLEASKITFGPEPKDYEVYDCLLQNWSKLQFSPDVKGQGMPAQRSNPKRMQREIQKALQTKGVSTKAQEALKLQQEAGKLRRKVRARKAREEEQVRKFRLRQEKRKEKHRGH